MPITSLDKDALGLGKRQLEILKTIFPKRNYTPKVGDRDIMFHEGQQSVINMIEKKLNEGW